MSVCVPILLPVYHRRASADPYAFQHMARASFLKHPPHTLRVSDLRQHQHDERRERGVARASLMVLVTGDQATIHTLDNWDQPKTPFLYHGEFPAADHPRCSELEDGYSLVPVYTTLSHFALTPCAPRPAQFVCGASAALEAGGVVIPHVLLPADLAVLRDAFGRAYRQSARAATWVVEGEQYNEATREPKRRRVAAPSPAAECGSVECLIKDAV